MSVPADFDVRLAAYLAGEGDPSERVSFEHLVQSDVASAEAFVAARAAWGARGIAARDADAAARFAERVVGRLHDDGEANGRVASPRAVPGGMPLGARSLPLGRRSLRPPKSIGWFASPLTVLGSIAATLIVAIPWMRTAVAPTTALQHARTFTAARGQRTAVVLGDGSRVVLASDTRVRYGIDNAGNRVVDLVGEAFFTIAARTDRAFIVRTQGVATRVLGTTFDVRHYPTDPSTRVTVVTGRVASGGRTAPIVLFAGSIGYVTDSTVTVSSTGNVAESVSWTEGNLVFRDTPVPIVLATLNRWYGYEFQIADTTLSSRHVSAEFRVDRVTETMNMLKTLLGATMTFDGKIVTLRGEQPRPTPVRSRHSRELFDNSIPEVGK